MKRTLLLLLALALPGSLTLIGCGENERIPAFPPPPKDSFYPDAGHRTDAGHPDGGPCPSIGQVLAGDYHFDGGSNPDGGLACTDPGQAMPNEGATHLAVGETHSYTSQPPSSGPHAPFLASWGIHDAAVPRENWVHNLEHGGVALVYNCPCGCPQIVQAFTDLYNATPIDRFNEVKLVVTPDPLFNGVFAASAWGYVYTPTDLDPDAFRCFIDTHIDHGPENAP